MTVLTGLIGWPLGHSRSPAMHNAAFAATGIDGIYIPMPVVPGDIPMAMAGLRALGFRGVNVTVPHKAAVLPYLDTWSATTTAIGAVNTIILEEDGTARGENTDASGFLADCAEQGFELSELDGAALVLGAGGSARAIVYALVNSGIATYVLARREQQARDLIADLSPQLTDRVPIQVLTPADRSQLAMLSLIVNCTPVGMVPHAADTPWPQEWPILPHYIIYDLVYNPRTTLFMHQARRAGAQAVNGLGMLLHQGAQAWQLWTGHEAPVAAMREALEESLGSDVAIT